LLFSFLQKIKPYPATSSTSSHCVEYKAKHVLTTIPIGVYESGTIAFDPPLPYPDSPYSQQQYQFKTKFWDDEEFIVALKKRGNEGICHYWQNLDHVLRSGNDYGPRGTSIQFYPGSKILFCTLNTEAMKALLGEDNVQTTNLSEERVAGPASRRIWKQSCR
jgi:hypothetical protein